MTFPTHPVAVLPLKLWRPRWFDGVALVRRAAPVVAAHLPAGGPFALRDYGARRVAGHAWWITVLSALLGAASHLVLDGIEGLVPRAEYPGHVLGALAMLALARAVGRRRLVRGWHGEAPPYERRPGRFWSIAALVALPGLVVTPLLPAAFLPHTSGVRVLTSLAVGLLVAAASSGSHRRSPMMMPRVTETSPAPGIVDFARFTTGCGRP